MFRLKNQTYRRLALGLLVVFATLFGGNTFFIHSHADLDGRVIAHSHPFLPGSTHSHSASQSVTIATLNQALLTMDMPGATTVDVPVTDAVTVVTVYVPAATDAVSVSAFGRAPPAVV